MKTQLVRIISLGLLLMVSSQCLALDYYKEVSKKFKVNNNAILGLETSFATITMTTWDESEISILVKINVDVKNESRAEQVFKSVEITESNSNPRLNISPAFRSKGNENFSINVEIKMPRSIGITGDVNFGNLTVSTITGALDVNLSYGNLSADELLSNANDISVSFGNAQIAQFGGGELSVDYGNVKLENVKGNLDAAVDFGNVRIIKVLSGCSSIEVDCQYGNIDMNARAGSYVLAESSYGDVDFHGTYRMISKEKDDFTKRYEAQTGEGKCKVKLEAGFGNIDVAFD